MTRVVLPGDDGEWAVLRLKQLDPDLDAGLVALARATRRTLTERQREVVILRIAAITGADYQWGRHVVSSREVGMTDGELGAIRDGRLDALAPVDALVAEYASAVEERTVDDALWRRLAEHYTPEAMLELTVLACRYSFYARLMLAVDLDLDADIQGLEHPQQR